MAKLAFGLIMAAAVAGCAADWQAPRAFGRSEMSGTEAVPAAPAPDAATLAQMIRDGEITAEAALTTYLARIEAYDRQGPQLQAIIALNPDALAEARALDEEAAQGRFRGPLHGVPVLVKDNIETKDLPTTAGSLAFVDNDTGRDAPIIARLRAQGAIILGKTNLSEWANFRSTNSNSGWSGVGGLTRNPHSLDRSACGSSSGSGAAVAANFVPLALGTETNGSIMCPSTMNGVFGFKPTVGLLPRTHIVPLSFTQDTAGPMARSVTDLALALNAMAGSDPADGASRETDRLKTDYMATLTDGVAGTRIGVMRFAQGTNPSTLKHFEEALETLEAAGATLVDIDEFSRPDTLWDDEDIVLNAEFKTTINQYLEQTPAKLTVHSLTDLIAFNEDHADRELALFGQEIFIAAEATDGIADPHYAPALTRLLKANRDNGIDKLLADYDVDVLVAPSRPPPFLIDIVFGDKYPSDNVGIDSMAAMAGYPNMTVPLGTDKNGLPLGFSIMSGAWQEATILRVGYVLADRRPAMVAPTFANGPMEHPATRAKLLPWKADAAGGANE